METLIIPDTIGCFAALLAFALYLLASAKVRRDVVRRLQRRRASPQQRGRLAPLDQIHHSFHMGDACEFGTAATVSEQTREDCLQASMSAHGKERTP